MTKIKSNDDLHYILNTIVISITIISISKKDLNNLFDLVFHFILKSLDISFLYIYIYITHDLHKEKISYYETEVLTFS